MASRQTFLPEAVSLSNMPLGAAPATSPVIKPAVLAEPLESLLAAHAIEPELLGLRPRWIQRFEHDPHPVFRRAIACILFVWVGCLAAYILWKLDLLPHWIETSSICLVWMLFQTLIGFYWTFAGFPGCARACLRDGIPTAAMIIDVKPLLMRMTRVSFVYRDPNGEYHDGRIMLRTSTLSERGFHPGSVFTLLVTPFDANTYVPYFLVDRSQVGVVQSTDVSLSAAKAAANATLSVPQTSYSLGSVEPELLGATPRRVRCKGHWARQIAIVYSFIAAMATAFVIYFSVALRFWALLRSYYGLFGVGFGTIEALVLCVQVFRPPYNSDKAVLKTALPARAVVVSIKQARLLRFGLQSTMTVSYQYESIGGKVESGSITLGTKRIRTLGIEIGSTFTVLYDARTPKVSTPYFSISSYEIVGGMGARITPP